MSKSTPISELNTLSNKPLVDDILREIQQDNNPVQSTDNPQSYQQNEQLLQQQQQQYQQQQSQQQQSQQQQQPSQQGFADNNEPNLVIPPPQGETYQDEQNLLQYQLDSNMNQPPTEIHNMVYQDNQHTQHIQTSQPQLGDPSIQSNHTVNNNSIHLQTKSKAQQFFEQLKEPLLVVLLRILLSLPIVNHNLQLLLSKVPVLNHNFINIFIKALITGVLFFSIKQFI